MPSPSSESCSFSLNILPILTVEGLLNWYFLLFPLSPSLYFSKPQRRKLFSQVREIRQPEENSSDFGSYAMGRRVLKNFHQTWIHMWLELRAPAGFTCLHPGFLTFEWPLECRRLLPTCWKPGLLRAGWLPGLLYTAALGHAKLLSHVWLAPSF